MRKEIRGRDGRVRTYESLDHQSLSDEDRYIVESPLSTRLLAEELGVSKSTISMIRRGLRRREDRVVYFIAGGDLIKIGKTFDIKARMPKLQCGSPVPLTLLKTHPGYSELESALHSHFASRRTHGEWFDVTLAEVEEYLSQVGQAA